MEAKIKQAIGTRDLAKVKELKLTKFESNNIVGLSEELKNLEELSITNVGLQSLKGFPNLTNLKKLELSDNQLGEGLDALTSLPKLAELNLSGNKIKDIEALQPLAEISTLKKLQLSGCDICQTKGYKEKVFSLIKSLTSLDGSSNQKNGKDDHDDVEEVDEEEDELDEEDEEELDGEDESLDEEDLDDEEDENEIPLTTLYNKTLEEGDDEEDEDFEAVEDEEDEDIEDEECDEETIANMSKENVDGPRGKKRKLDAPKESEAKK